MTPNTKLTPLPRRGFSFSLRSPNTVGRRAVGPRYAPLTQAWRGLGRHGGERGLTWMAQRCIIIGLEHDALRAHPLPIAALTPHGTSAMAHGLPSARVRARAPVSAGDLPRACASKVDTHHARASDWQGATDQALNRRAGPASTEIFDAARRNPLDGESI